MKEKTSYVPSFISLINIKEIKINFDKYICNFYNTDNEIEYSNGYFWIKRQRKKKIDKKVIDSAIVYAIENYEGDKLLF